MELDQGLRTTPRESGVTPITIQNTKIGEEVLVPSCVCGDGMVWGHRGIDQCRTDPVSERGNFEAVRET